MRISDWSSDVCSSDLPAPASSATPAPLPSSWPRSPSPARWCGPSLPPSAVFERLRHAHDHDPCPSCTKAAGQVRLPRGKAALPGQNSSRSEEHTSELQSLMRISYAVFCLKTKKHTQSTTPQ